MITLIRDYVQRLETNSAKSVRTYVYVCVLVYEGVEVRNVRDSIRGKHTSLEAPQLHAEGRHCPCRYRLWILQQP